MSAELEELEAAIGYVFKDKSLLTQALTYVDKHRHPNLALQGNGYLAFLGDKVIGLAVTQYMLTLLKNESLGLFHDSYSWITSNQVLAETARSINLSQHVRFLPVGEERRVDQPTHMKTLADCFEAIFGAMLIDSGHNYKMISDILKPLLGFALNAPSEVRRMGVVDTLYFVGQAIFGQRPEFRVTENQGRSKRFHVEVYLLGACLGMADGKTEKIAKQKAARSIMQMTDGLRSNLPQGLPKLK